MPTSLSIATLGHMPVRTPFTLATMGLLDDPRLAVAANQGGTQFGILRQGPAGDIWQLGLQAQAPTTQPGTDAGLAVTTKTIDVDGETVEIEIPSWEPPEAPISAGALPLHAIEGDLDRELARESRIEAIQQHSRQASEALQAHKKFEEDAAVAVALLLC